MLSADTNWIVTIRRTRPDCSPARPNPFRRMARSEAYLGERKAMKKKRIQVLLADTDHQCRDALKLKFQDAGFHVIIADSGADVALQCDLEPPNVLILDTQLPDMDAFDLCESIRRDSSETDMIVIIVTELSEELNQNQLEQRVEYVGADHFVIKPYESRQMVELVNELIEEIANDRPTTQPVFPTRVSWPTHSPT